LGEGRTTHKDKLYGDFYFLPEEWIGEWDEDSTSDNNPIQFSEIEVTRDFQNIVWNNNKLKEFIVFN
jgi:hypothetical protein